MTLRPQSLAELRARTSAKWRTHPSDVLPLFVAEHDYALAEPVAAALHERIRLSDTGYSSHNSELPEAFVSFAAELWDWTVDPEQVWCTADVSMGVVECLRRVTQPGDGVVITPPVYPPFYELVREAGATVVEAPLLLAEGAADHSAWSLDLEAIERAFSAGAKAMVLCNPHNPLGHPHRRAELEQLALIAERYGAHVISDEIHAPLTHSDAQYVPYLTVSDAAREHGVAITSASKAFNLAGLKCALMVTASPRMRAVVSGMYQEVFWRTAHLGVHANIAAFRDGRPWLRELLADLELRRAQLAELLGERLPGVGYLTPGASYLAWLDVRSLNLGKNPAERLLRDARVALSPGADFGGESTGFVRLNFGCSEEVLTEAIERIAAATIDSHDRQ